MRDSRPREASWIRSILPVVLVLAVVLLLPGQRACGGEKWPGVDEAVVQKIAGENGRRARPLLDLEGDAQLFAFLVAGAAGGFAAGYWWRMLVAERRKK